MDNNKKDPLIKSRELHWYKRAQVSCVKPYEDVPFKADRYDFLPELMPFNDHPLWGSVDQSSKQRVASYGWLMYNMRTVCIETKIISPLCYSIIEGKNQIAADLDFLRIITQALVDESYHTLLSLEGIEGVVVNRDLMEISFPEQNFFKNYQTFLLKCSRACEREIAQIGMVVAAEVLISDYLALIATSETIQPLCRLVTRTHWKDELAHATIFKLIAEKIISRFTVEQKEFFIECIINSSNYFADKEFETWNMILTCVDIPSAVEIINDSKLIQVKNEETLADRKINALVDLLRRTEHSRKAYFLPMIMSSN